VNEAGPQHQASRSHLHRLFLATKYDVEDEPVDGFPYFPKRRLLVVPKNIELEL
jgi:hypothetical protein